MLELPLEIREHLERGGTLIVGSRQRAAAVGVAYSAAMLGAGRAVWDSPDVLPWSAWLDRELAEARVRGAGVPTRLSPLADWLLWREAVVEIGGAQGILAPDQLAGSVQAAAAILEEYGLRVEESASAETALLCRACLHYRRRCRELGAIGRGFGACAEFLRPSARLLLAGFGRIGPVLERWLTRHGARLASSEGWPGGEPRIVTASDPQTEAQAAADWCARSLQSDPQARLLIVVPGLPEQRHLWQRALAQRLDYDAILAGSDAPSRFAIEGGAPLSSYPLVTAALDLITLASGEARFEQTSALLRSPYLTRLERRACLRLDGWLREHNREVSSAATLRAVAARAASVGEAAAAVAATLAEGLEACASGAPEGAGWREWAQRFAALLAHCGWPGAQLGSDELQVRVRFDELLGELASMGTATSQPSLSSAAALLIELARRIAFEPASEDVPVTVTGSLEDPIVRYDGIWVAGLTADAWPAPARPDPLIPPTLQRAAGLPGSSAATQLQRARELQALWIRHAARCVLSWPQSERDLPLARSPLLGEAPEAAIEPQEPFSLEQWLAAHPAPGEPWIDESGPQWPADRPLRGGVRLLEQQALCPFRGFAESRLGAMPLQAPLPGIDASLRGRILHRALELFWRALGGRDALESCGREAGVALAADCAARAVEEIGARAVPLGQGALLARERARTERILQQLIEWELRRPPFTVQALEWGCELAIAGTRLPMRLDRVDRLEDGRLVVIDYKSGRPRSFLPHEQRPSQPQLPAYALAAGPEVAAVAAVYLGRERLKVAGTADRADRLSGLRAAPGPWSALLADWQRALGRLLGELLEGQARVDPQPKACDRCHLQMLCRVDTPRVAARASAAAEAADDGAADGAEDGDATDGQGGEGAGGGD